MRASNLGRCYRVIFKWKSARELGITERVLDEQIKITREIIAELIAEGH